MRKIFCTGCDKYLGEIRDAKLLKDIKFLCPKCDDRRKTSSECGNIFNTLFRGA